MNLDAPEWKELIRLARRGDAVAFGRMMEICRARLQTLAKRQLRGRVAVRVDASDVVQQTLSIARSAGLVELVPDG